MTSTVQYLASTTCRTLTVATAAALTEVQLANQLAKTYLGRFVNVTIPQIPGAPVIPGALGYGTTLAVAHKLFADGILFAGSKIPQIKAGVDAVKQNWSYNGLYNFTLLVGLTAGATYAAPALGFALTADQAIKIAALTGTAEAAYAIFAALFSVAGEKFSVWRVTAIYNSASNAKAAADAQLTEKTKAKTNAETELNVKNTAKGTQQGLLDAAKLALSFLNDDKKNEAGVKEALTTNTAELKKLNLELKNLKEKDHDQVIKSHKEAINAYKPAYETAYKAYEADNTVGNEAWKNAQAEMKKLKDALKAAKRAKDNPEVEIRAKEQEILVVEQRITLLNAFNAAESAFTEVDKEATAAQTKLNNATNALTRAQENANKANQNFTNAKAKYDAVNGQAVLPAVLPAVPPAVPPAVAPVVPPAVAPVVP